MSATWWTTALLGICAFLYFCTSMSYYFNSRPGMMIAFLGYAIANGGLIYDAFNTVSK